MIKTGTFRTFLLIFLLLTGILPILTTFLFLGSMLLSSFGDQTGSGIMKYGAILFVLVWFFSQSVLLILLGADRLIIRSKIPSEEENDLG
ncbi:MAG: hypothetical protein Q4G69_11040 [Planctomycetia bacterium]|nr:hypothetical protein [Planctomycetia bacterium]